MELPQYSKGMYRDSFGKNTPTKQGLLSMQIKCHTLKYAEAKKIPYNLGFIKHTLLWW